MYIKGDNRGLRLFKMATPSRRLRVLELYSGIGGMHFAIQASGIPHVVVSAIDISPIANRIYTHNFPHTPLSACQIQALTVKQLNKLDVDLIWMSPPCQPFTRVGKKQDTEDPRTASFMHILTLLPRLAKVPEYILVENVKGFDISQAKQHLCETLRQCKYHFQEFLLTPLQFGIPNSRLRYYLIAKTKRLDFCFPVSDRIQTELPACAEKWCTFRNCALKTEISPGEVPNGSYKEYSSYHLDEELEHYGESLRLSENSELHSFPGCRPIDDFLEHQAPEYFHQYLVPEELLKRFIVMEIITPSITKSMCFTKRYGRYMDGAGSIIQMSRDVQAVKEATELKSILVNKPRDDWQESHFEILRRLKLRYFTPREIANMLCFKDIKFPEGLTVRQLHQALGNSLNVHVVSILLRLLTGGDFTT